MMAEEPKISDDLAAELLSPEVVVKEPDAVDEPSTEEAIDDPDIECGFCLRRNLAMEDPKVLPCGHIHCLECLTGFFDLNHLVLCPTLNCGKVCEDELSKLPTHGVRSDKDNSMSCDVCAKKATDIQLATIYCKDCSRRFCDEHHETHNEVLMDHAIITIDQYKDEAMKLEKRTCSVHKDNIYQLGCKVCRTIICVECFGELDPCSNGAAHDTLSLTKLVKMLMKDDIEHQMVSKEDKLENLFKAASKANSEYDAMTAELIASLHKKRDEQLQAIRQKYDEFESELLKKRRERKAELAEFMEGNVYKKWSDLRNYRLKIESRDRYSHQVDIVRRYQEVKDEMKKFVDEELPKLEIDSVVTLRDKCEQREIELKFGSYHGLAIDNDDGLVSKSWIKSVTQLKNVPADKPNSASHHNGDTYIALGKSTLAKIDSNCQLQELAIKCNEAYISSVVVYKDRIYTYSGVSVVSVFDMSGTLIKDWKHDSGCSSYNDVLAIVSDQIVLPDKANTRLTVYSLDGEELKQIANPQLANIVTTMCAIDDDSVLVCISNQAFRVNIAADKVMWTCDGLNQAKGVTQCDQKFALIACNGKISTLDIERGIIISELTDSGLPASDGYGLEVFGTTLVVTSYGSSQVFFYQLN